MSKAFYKIEDFLDTTSSAFALKGTSPLSEDATEVTMCSSADVLAEIEDNFGERSIYIKETETPMIPFAAMWTRWLSRRGNMLAASWQVLHTEYNPLENYDRKVEGSDTKTITPAEVTHTMRPAETTETIRPAETTETVRPAETTETVSPAETTTTITPAETTNTTTPAETTETEKIKTPGAVTTQDNQVYAFNSVSAVDVAKTTTTENRETSNEITVQEPGTDELTVQTSGSEVLTLQTAGTNELTVQTAGSNVQTVQTAGSNVQTVQTAGSDVLSVQESGEEVTEYGQRIHGNIGVTTAEQMAEQEIALREKDLVYRAICEFIQLYTIYV